MKYNILMPLALFSFLFTFINNSHAQSAIDPGFIEKPWASEKHVLRRVLSEQQELDSGFTVSSNNFHVNFYRCEWTVDPAIQYISGKITSVFTITQATDKIVFDLSDSLKVDSIFYHGALGSFQRISNGGLQIQFPATLAQNQKDSVTIFYQGVPPASGLGSFTTTTHSGGVPILWTLSEPYGSKEWWPCKNGLTDKADSLDVFLTYPSSYQGTSNGLLINEQVNGGMKTSYFKHRYPVASYLVAIAVSNYTVITDTITIGNNVMYLQDFVYPEWANVFIGQRIYTRNSLYCYGSLFGDYAFAKEKYGYTQFQFGGGMEHQTNSFLKVPIIPLVTHETAHQWFGDKITCGSWQDIWLNEGFASYLQILYNEYYDPVNYIGGLQSFVFNATSQPNGSVFKSDTSDVHLIFDNLSYYKGAYLLHMLRWRLGDSTFFRGMRRYFNDPLLVYNFAKSGDFIRNMQQESGKDLSVFFQKWLYGQGYPIYTVNWTQDSNNYAFLRIDQATTDPSVSFYDMPVPLQFHSSTKDTIIVFDHIKSGQTFLANPGFKADTILFDPNLWILTGKNTTTNTGCSLVSNSDNLLPVYKISWMQNANQWIKLDVVQTNTNVSSLADSIPLFLHFSGNGKDSVIVLKNIHFQLSQWMNIGFPVTNVFVTTSSCFLVNAFTITQQSNSVSPNDLKIYPVPAYNSDLFISIKNPSGKKLNVNLYNVRGQLMYQHQFDTPGKDELFTIPVSYLPRGSYFVRIQNEGAFKVVRKIIR